MHLILWGLETSYGHMDKGSLLEITWAGLAVPISGSAITATDLGDGGSAAIRRRVVEIEETVREAFREGGRVRQGGRR